MDGTDFDRITKRLGSDASRRQLLGGVIGTTAAVLAGATMLEAKSKNKGKGKGKAKGKGKNGNHRGNGKHKGAGSGEVQFCHRNNGKKGYNLIEVGAPAAKAHEGHGDLRCEPEPCFVATSCDAEGACITEPGPEGTACELEEGVAGTCNATGACVIDDTGAEG